MSTASTHSLPSDYASMTRVARKLGIATAATVALTFGVYDLWHATAVAPASTGMQVMPLAERVAPSTALPGYVVTQRPRVVTSPVQWAAGVERTSDPQVESSRLQRLGFVAGVDEQLHGRYPNRSEAISIAEQYRSAAGASAELVHQYAASTAAAGGRTSPFAVVGIPGAKAWQVDDGRTRAVNVAFSTGRFFYIVGGSLPASTSIAAARDQIVRAAQLTFLVSNGCVAMGGTAQPAPAPQADRPTFGPLH